MTHFTELLEDVAVVLARVTFVTLALLGRLTLVVCAHPIGLALIVVLIFLFNY